MIRMLERLCLRLKNKEWLRLRFVTSSMMALELAAGGGLGTVPFGSARKILPVENEKATDQYMLSFGRKRLWPITWSERRGPLGI